jgi:hypothetical protein
MDTPDKLVEVAQHESDPELTRRAISDLGALGAVSQLSTMYQSSTSKDAKLAVINAFVAAGEKGGMHSAPSPRRNRIPIFAAKRSAIWE